MSNHQTKVKVRSGPCLKVKRSEVQKDKTTQMHAPPLRLQQLTVETMILIVRKPQGKNEEQAVGGAVHL